MLFEGFQRQLIVVWVLYDENKLFSERHAIDLVINTLLFTIGFVGAHSVDGSLDCGSVVCLSGLILLLVQLLVHRLLFCCSL